MSVAGVPFCGASRPPRDATRSRLGNIFGALIERVRFSPVEGAGFEYSPSRDRLVSSPCPFPASLRQTVSPFCNREPRVRILLFPVRSPSLQWILGLSAKRPALSRAQKTSRRWSSSWSSSESQLLAHIGCSGLQANWSAYWGSAAFLRCVEPLQADSEHGFPRDLVTW